MKDAINYLLLTLEIQRWGHTEAGAGLRHLGNETRAHMLYKTGAHASLGNLVSGLPCYSHLVGSRQLTPKDYLSWKCITSLATESLRNCLEWSPKGIFPKCLLWWKKINTTSKLIFSNYILKEIVCSQRNQCYFWGKRTEELAEWDPALLTCWAGGQVPLLPGG